MDEIKDTIENPYDIYSMIDIEKTIYIPGKVLNIILKPKEEWQLQNK